MIRRVRIVRRQPPTIGGQAIKGWTFIVMMGAFSLAMLGVGTAVVGPIATVAWFSGLFIGMIASAVAKLRGK